MARSKPSAKKTDDAKASSASVGTIDADALRAGLRKIQGDRAVPEPENLLNVPVTSTGLVSLDLALGIGGYPKGRMTYMAGPKHVGKTVLALLGVATIQRDDPTAVGAIIDVEHAYTESLAKVCGVDTDPARFIVIRPETAEKAIDAALYLMGFDTKDDGRTWNQARPSIAAIIYDSWAGSPTEEVGMAVLARVGAERLPHLSMCISRADCTFFMINQIRMKPGQMFGNPEYEPGGEALKHAYSIQLQLHKVGEVQKDASGVQCGHTIKVFIAKNKCAPGYKTVYVDLNYFSGFDAVKDAFSAAQLLGLDFKEKAGGNILLFSGEYEGETCEIRANGETNFLNALRTDAVAGAAFLEYVSAQIRG
jgi:recombination protein RecA